jgi:hypothetical protein
VRRGSRRALRRSWRDLPLVLLPWLAWGCTEPNPAFHVEPPVEPDAAAESADASPPPDRATPPPDRAPPDAAPPEDVAPAADVAIVPLPDAAPPPDVATDLGSALLVVGDTTLAKGDAQFRDRLIKLGFTVAIKDGQVATAADAAGRALVVLSGSSWSDDVGAKFRDVAVPVLVFDCALFAPMKLTGTREGTDWDSVDDTRLMIVDDTHPLAGGLSGLVTVSDVKIQVSWGAPSTGAIKVGTVADQPTHYTVFGYAEGNPMVGMIAPARRVGAFVRFPDTAAYTESGLMLFGAAALWATSHLE